MAVRCSVAAYVIAAAGKNDVAAVVVTTVTLTRWWSSTLQQTGKVTDIVGGSGSAVSEVVCAGTARGYVRDHGYELEFELEDGPQQAAAPDSMGVSCLFSGSADMIACPRSVA